jgi:predicted HAD superfamily Cof-like phosphohydrolase
LKTSKKQSTTWKMNTSFKSNYLAAAEEFRRKFQLPTSTPLQSGSLNLQRTLIVEEYNELMEALAKVEVDPSQPDPKAEALKELVDLVYVCFQMAAAFGWDIDLAHTIVHESNLSKLGPDNKPIRREDGKIMKGPYYFKPNLIRFVV